MSSDTSSSKVLTTIAHSLVVENRYDSVEDALQAIALAEVRRKIATYRRRIRALARKYDMDFDTLSARLRGRATPAEEDDWFAWHSANRMLSDWLSAYESLQHDQPRS
jgi:hypothetical protein